MGPGTSGAPQHSAADRFYPQPLANRGSPVQPGIDIDPVLGPNPACSSYARNFYTEFLAAYDVDKSAGRHFGAIAREAAADNEIIVTRHPTSASALARTFGVDVGLLRELNLGLRDAVWNGRMSVPAGYAVRVPKVAGRASAEQLMASLLRGEAAREASGSTSSSAKSHRVRRGDTITKVAKKYGVSTSALAKTNRLGTHGQLRVGQTLRIPGAAIPDEAVAAADSAPTKSSAKPPTRASGAAKAKPKGKATPASNSAKTKPSVRSHTVKPGETLTAIARSTGISVKQLAAANGFSATHRVRAGQRLRIPD